MSMMSGHIRQEQGFPDLSRARKDMIELFAFKAFFGMASKALSLPSGLIIAQLLGPHLFGILAILRMVQQYAGYCHLGLLDAMPRNVPMAYGRGDKAEARRIENIVCTGLLVMSAGALLILWGLFLFGITFSGALNYTRLTLASLIIGSEGSLTLLRDYSKAEGQFMPYAKSDALLGVISPFLTVPAVFFFKLEGMLASTLVVNVITVSYLFVKLQRPRFLLEFDLSRTIDLLKTGFVIFISKVSEGVFWGIDLVVIAVMLSPRDAGIYNLALAVLAAVPPFMGAINQTVYRNMMFAIGVRADESGTELRRYLEAPLVCYLMLQAIITSVGTLSLMAVVKCALTNYADTVPILILLSGGYMVFGTNVFLRFYLNATGQLYRRLPIILGGVFFNLLLDWILLKAGYGVFGAAMGCTLSFIGVTVCTARVCFRQLYGDSKEATRFLTKLMFVSALITMVIWGLSEGQRLFIPESLTNLGRIGWVALAWCIELPLITAFIVTIYQVVFREFKIDKELKPMIVYVRDSVIARLSSKEPP